MRLISLRSAASRPSRAELAQRMFRQQLFCGTLFSFLLSRHRCRRQQGDAAQYHHMLVTIREHHALGVGRVVVILQLGVDGQYRMMALDYLMRLAKPPLFVRTTPSTRWSSSALLAAFN